MNSDNKYTQMQKNEYFGGTSNHPEHNSNPDYWDILLGDLKDKENWNDKVALDFACGKGRNVSNMFNLCNWNRVDGIDISIGNIDYNKETYKNQNSNWYSTNGIDVSDLKAGEYDFIMSTIALQHIPVYDIRKSLISDLFRTLKPNGLFNLNAVCNPVTLAILCVWLAAAKSPVLAVAAVPSPKLVLPVAATNPVAPPSHLNLSVNALFQLAELSVIDAPHADPVDTAIPADG